MSSHPTAGAPVVVVGGGVAGLACARALHRAGWPVLVFEREGAVGGRARSRRVDGYTIDRGFQVLFTAYPVLGAALGFAPELSLVGVVDFGVDPDLADDIAAVAREALTNVAKHACATAATVELWVTPDDVTLVITDDGVGIGEPARRSGVANLRARAERRGGAFSVGGGHAGGTVLRWHAPVR